MAVKRSVCVEGLAKINIIVQKKLLHNSIINLQTLSYIEKNRWYE